MLHVQCLQEVNIVKYSYDQFALHVPRFILNLACIL